MIWKPKERELTEEEALELARKELAPVWLNSPPQLAAVRLPDGVLVYPLDAKFVDRPWLAVCVDITDYATTQVIQFAREWQRRYVSHELGVLLVLRSPYTELRTPSVMTQLLKRLGVHYPAVIDQEGLLSNALGVRGLPHQALLHQKKVVFAFGPTEWSTRTEIAIQNFLRLSDPGLPLQPIYQPGQPVAPAITGLELGRTGALPFPKPGFGPPENGFGRAKFMGSVGDLSSRSTSRLALSGTWLQDADRIATSEPGASLSFFAPGTEVAIVARTLAPDGKTVQALIEINGAPAFDMFCAAEVQLDEEGVCTAALGPIRVYPLLSKLPSDSRLVTLRFPHADRAAVAIYGVRFAGSTEA